MGAAGRERARADYDWRAIIPRYEALWTELGAIRAAAPVPTPGHPWAARMDPFAAFASYPTAQLTSTTTVALTDDSAHAARARLRAMTSLDMARFAHPVLPTVAEIDLLIDACAGGPRPAREIAAAIPAERRATVFRALAWLAKNGVVRMVG